MEIIVLALVLLVLVLAQGGIALACYRAAHRDAVRRQAWVDQLVRAAVRNSPVAIARVYVGTDPDSLVGGDEVYVLAMALNQAMHRDPAARGAYRAVWGTDWSPLGSVDGSAFFPVAEEPAVGPRDRTVARRTVRG